MYRKDYALSVMVLTFFENPFGFYVASPHVGSTGFLPGCRAVLVVGFHGQRILTGASLNEALAADAFACVMLAVLV